jgi:hypothetical protein
MTSTYIVAFSAMTFSAVVFVTIVAVISRMWHLGE